jgi:imidazolonepropionase-like amidohydrolase
MVGTTIFRAARLWDGVGSSRVEDGFVLVDGERIAAVGRWAELSESILSGGSSGAIPVLDCGGATLLPGLINSHVHLTLSGSMNVLDDYLVERGRGEAVPDPPAVRGPRSGASQPAARVRRSSPHVRRAP